MVVVITYPDNSIDQPLKTSVSFLKLEKCVRKKGDKLNLC